MTWDVLVIGAGPVGSTVAGLLSEQGHNVVLLEEHRKIGKPMACGGLVSPKLRELAPFSFPVQNHIKGAFISGPDGREIELSSSGEKAIVLDRTGFDALAAQWAVSKGTELRLGSRVTMLKIGRNGVAAKLSNGDEIDSRLVIGAEGPGSITATAASLPPIREIVTGVEMEAIGTPRKVDHVEVFTGESVGKGFFSWMIPSDGRRMRIGTGVYNSKSSALQSFHHLIAHSLHSTRFRDIQPLSFHAGGIPIGMRSRLYSDSVLVVGDAAGLAKPVSGGGIITGLISAKIAAKVVGQALEKDNLSASSLAPYQKKLRNEVGRELKRAMRLRKAFMFLPDPGLNRLFSLLSKKDIMSVMNEKGDIDYPGKLALELVRTSPQLLPFGLKHLGKSFFS